MHRFVKANIACEDIDCRTQTLVPTALSRHTSTLTSVLVCHFFLYDSTQYKHCCFSGALKLNLGPSQMKEDLVNLGLSDAKASHFAEQVSATFLVRLCSRSVCMLCKHTVFVCASVVGEGAGNSNIGQVSPCDPPPRPRAGLVPLRPTWVLLVSEHHTHTHT